MYSRQLSPAVLVPQSSRGIEPLGLLQISLRGFHIYPHAESESNSFSQSRGRHAQTRSQNAAVASELQSLSSTSSPRPSLIRRVNYESSQDSQSPRSSGGFSRANARGGFRSRGTSGGFVSRGGNRGGQGGARGRGRGGGQRGGSRRGGRARSNDDSLDFNDFSVSNIPKEETSADLEAIAYLEKRREEIQKATRSLKVYQPEEVTVESLVKTGPGVEGSVFGVKAAVEEGMRQVANRRVGEFVGGNGLAKRLQTGEWVLFEEGEREELAEFQKASDLKPEHVEMQGLKEEQKTETLNKLVAGQYTPITEKGILGVLQTKLRANSTYTDADSKKMLDKIRELLPPENAKKPVARR